MAPGVAPGTVSSWLFRAGVDTGVGVGYLARGAFTSFLVELDRHAHGTGPTQELNPGVERAQMNEARRVAEVSMVKRDVSPGSVVGDVSDRRIEAGRCGVGRE